MAAIPRIRPCIGRQSFPPSLAISSRTFTSTSRRTQQNQPQRAAAPILQKTLAGRKTLTASMKNLRRGDIPSDLGILPQTFIKPEWKDLPPLLSTKLRRRLQIEWMAFMQKFKDFVGLYYLSRWAVKKHPVTGKRQKRSMGLRERYSNARKLQKELYTAIAQADNRAINNIACQGLQKQIKIRLDYRQSAQLSKEDWKVQYRGFTPPEKVPWFLQAIIPFKSTRIITDRTGELPFGKDSRLRQVVVKIRSRQTLDKFDGNGPTTKDADEYFVIQQMTFEGKEEDWMVWGTAKPASPQQIDELLTAPQSNETVWQRIKQTAQNYMSGVPPTM